MWLLMNQNQLGWSKYFSEEVSAIYGIMLSLFTFRIVACRFGGIPYISMLHKHHKAEFSGIKETKIPKLFSISTVNPRKQKPKFNIFFKKTVYHFIPAYFFLCFSTCWLLASFISYLSPQWRLKVAYVILHSSSSSSQETLQERSD